MTPLVSFLAAAAWSAILLAAGARLRHVLRCPAAPGLRIPIDGLLGAWALGILTLGFGLAGAFRAGVLLLLACLLAAAGRWRGQGWRFGSVIGPAAAAAVFLPLALSPPFFFDALAYHLALPWQALLEGRIAAHPESFYASFPPLAQLVAAGPLSIGLDRVPALLHLAGFVAAGAALTFLARRLGAPVGIAVLAGCALPLLPALVPVPGFPAAEGWALDGIVAAVAVAAFGRGGRGDALLAGLLLGCASAARLQALPWTLLVILFLVARTPAPLARSGVAVAGWLAGSAPWWLKNLILLGSPLLPLGWRGAGLEAEWRDAGVNLYRSHGVLDFALSTLRGLAPHAVWLLPLAVAAALSLAGARRRVWLLAALVPAGVVAWNALGAVARFLAPSVALLLALAAAAGRSRAGHRGAGRWIATGALGVAIVSGLLPAVQLVDQWGGARLAFSSPGGVSRLIVDDPRPVFDAARDLPPEARVLFVGETRGYPFPRRFVAPSPYDVSILRAPLESLSSAGEVRDRLRGEGFTHLLVSRTELARLATGYPVVPWTTAGGQRRFQELLDLLAPAVVRIGDVGIFDLASRSSVSRDVPALGVRNGHALAYDSDRGRVLLFGGADEGRVLGDLWEWDGSTWRRLASEGPPPRTFPALAYDRARKRLVLFGGNRVLFGKDDDHDTLLQDMWEWYGGSWHEVAWQTPPARSEAAMVYDSSRRRLVLFGGWHGSGSDRERLGDTWEFDGSRWTRMETPRAPSARSGAAMTYDSDRRRVVLFGGSDGPKSDTWEWDGSAWREVDAPTAGRFNSVMVYADPLKQVVRFGGWNGSAREGDTLRYDGRRWEPIPGKGPEPRNHASMAFDERRRVIVLFGGHDGENVFGDTWEWSAGVWARVRSEPPRKRIDNGHQGSGRARWRPAGRRPLRRAVGAPPAGRLRPRSTPRWPRPGCRRSPCPSSIPRGSRS